jgi:hypothetical protein
MRKEKPFQPAPTLGIKIVLTALCVVAGMIVFAHWFLSL